MLPRESVALTISSSPAFRDGMAAVHRTQQNSRLGLVIRASIQLRPLSGDTSTLRIDVPGLPCGSAYPATIKLLLLLTWLQIAELSGIR